MAELMAVAVLVNVLAAEIDEQAGSTAESSQHEDGHGH
jgi:hypothetical protein